jgi:hypothetical protein
MGGGLFQTSFNSLQRFNSFALEKTFARSRQDWLGRETILNPQRIFHKAL